MAYSRNEYLQSLNRMRANYQNQGNPLINRENDDGNVGNELSAFAYMDTAPKAPEQASKRTDFLGQLFGSIDELAFHFGSGYVNGWEGGLDLGANVLGAITGNNNFDKWAEQDLGAQTGRYLQTYLNLTPWAIIDNAKKGNYADKDWRGNAISGFGDIVTSAFGGWDENQIVQSVLSGGVSALMALIGTGLTEAGNAIGGKGRKADAYADNYTEDMQQRYGFDTSPISDTETGQFVGGIAHSIGEMLPSIQIGLAVGKGMTAGNAGLGAMRGKAGISAGSKAMRWIPKLSSTGMMGLSSAGHASNEAKQEGATKAQALGYGLASGAIEMATEWIFPDGGVGGVKVDGTIKKSIAKEFVKEMFEEGLEEVVSELHSPLLKMIYKDDAYKEYLTGDYWKQVGLAGASGAITGGLMSGVQGISNKAQYGKNCSEYLEHSQNISELYDKAEKAKNKGKTADFNKYQKAIETEYVQMMDALERAVADKSATGKKNLTNMLKRLRMVNGSSTLSRQEQVSKGTQALMDEYTDYTARKNAQDYKKWLAENRNKDNAKYTMSVQDADRVMQTKLENKDGTAKRYVFLDEPDEFNNRIIEPATNDDEFGFYVYANNPLNEANLSKALPFDKISKEFNIPASLEKTYSKKLANKNPLSVIEFIGRYANTDAKGVLAKLGYDAFEYKDGRIIINDGKQLIGGDLKYGETKGTNDYSSLVKRLGREGADGKLRGYLGQNGKELATKEARQEYAQLIRDNRAYESTTFKNNDIMVVDKAVYTREMLEIEERNNKLGAKTKFILNDSGKIRRASGFYDNDGTIYLVLNRADPRTLTQRNEHEVFHYLDEVYYATAISNLEDIYHQWAKEYPEEYKKWLDAYELAYKDIYTKGDAIDYHLLIQGEIMAEIYSKHIVLEDKALQQRFIDTVDKVASLGEEKATQKFNNSIANENFKPVTVRYTIEIGENANVTSRNEEQYATVAPYYFNPANLKNIDQIRDGVEKRYLKSARQLAKSLGIKIESVDVQLGSWKGGGELSYSWTFKKGVNSEAIKMFSYLQSDLNGEVQNAVIHGKYLSSDTKDNFSWEFRFKVNNSGEAHKALLKSGLHDNTIKIENNTVQLFDDGSEDFEQKVVNALEALKNDNNYVGDSYEKCKCETWFGNAFDRRVAYQERLSKGENGGQEWDKVRFDNYRTALTNVEEALTKKFDSFKTETDFLKYCKKNWLLNEDGTVDGNVLSWKKEYFERKKATSFEDLHEVKIISNKKAKSSTVLIEAGADVSKSTKVRLKSVQQAFDNALQELIPDNGTYKLKFGDVIVETFAELNLSKPKDRNTAVDNMIKRLKSTEVTLENVFGGEKVELGNLMSVEDETQARKIMLETLNNKSEPTKLAKWAKALSLARLESNAIKEHVILKNRFERRIEASKTLNYGYGNAPTAKLTVFENILKTVPRFWDNKGVVAFADSVLSNYNESNLQTLFDEYGIMYDENIYAIAENLKQMVVPGKHLDPRVQMQADALLKVLFNNLENVDSAVKSVNVKYAEKDANTIQSMYHDAKHNGAVKGMVKKVLANIDNSVTSPVDFLKRRAWGTELQRFVEEDTGDYENREIAYVKKYKDKLFKELATKQVEKTINKKFTFKGEKISYGVALDRLNSYKTLGEKFFNAKGSIKNADSTRADVVYTEEDIAELERLIPQELLDYNDKVIKVLNTELKSDIAELYRKATGTDLVMLDDESIWYNISRVTDNFFGANMGGVSMRDINLSMFNKRVNSRADINFNLDIQTHLTNYLNKAFKVLVWTPYVTKLNTLLNTRVYGTTNNKIYQQNIVGFDKQMDLFIHQVLGVPFETRVSTISNVAGKVVGNLNAVRVATVQAGMRTVSSAPIFAKYFGAKVAFQGAWQNFKNGDIIAFNKNMKIIKANSPYFAKRFTSEEVALAETGIKASNKLMKIFGTPLRFGDAIVHVTTGFAMAQVQAEKEGYGKPYTQENNKRAVWLLEQASKSTQPTNAIGRVAGFRYGNGIAKYLFGLYGSMKQVFYNAMVAPVEEIVTANTKIKSMENAIQEHENKIVEYKEEARNANERMNNATTDEEFEEARKDYEKFQQKVVSRTKARDNTVEILKAFKLAHTPRKMLNKLAGALGGLLFSSLLYVAIRNLISMWEGKKSIKDINIKNMSLDTLEQAFLNSLPYLSTIYASIKNNSDLSIATVDNLNNTIDAVKKFVEAIESGNGGHITGASWNILKEVSQYFGVPLSAMARLVNGTWYNIDKQSNVDVHNWLGMLSGSKLKTNYNDAVSKGDKRTAIANLEVWTNNYSIRTSSEVLEEIYRLNKVGETGVAPSAIKSTYTDENGNEIKLTSAQINAFKQEYGKADKGALALLKTESYMKQNDKAKASAIKRLYSAYRESALAKVTGVAPNSKLGKLLYYTNGDIDMAKYIASLQNLSAITEDKKHSRKENVVSAINKMSGFNKQEKLLLAYLSGYSISDNNKQTMVNFLVRKGFDTKTAKTFLGLDKK